MTGWPTRVLHLNSNVFPQHIIIIYATHRPVRSRIFLSAKGSVSANEHFGYEVGSPDKKIDELKMRSVLEDVTRINVLPGHPGCPGKSLPDAILATQKIMSEF
jgi:hypothetical protein